MEAATRKATVGPRDQGRRMTLGAFAEAEGEAGRRYELDRGVVQVIEVPGLPHDRVLDDLNLQVTAWRLARPGIAQHVGFGGGCVLRLPGMQSERHPDMAIYLTPPPAGPSSPWDRWTPDIVVEVVSESSRKRDYGPKRADYLAAGIREYWIIDAPGDVFIALLRKGDIFEEHAARDTYATPLLPGLTLDVVRLRAAGA